MNIYAVFALVNFLTSAGLAGVVLRRNYRHPLNITFALFAGSVAFWSFGYFFWQFSSEASSALLWARFLMAGAILIPATYLHFVLVLTNLAKQYRRFLLASYILFGVFLLLNMTPLFVREVAPVLVFPFWPVPGVMFHIFLILWSLYIGFTTYVLYTSYKRATGLFHAQLKYVLLGMIVGFAGGSTNYFLWYGIPIPPIANITVSFYVLALSYAVLKHQLFSVKVIATELFTFLLWLLLLARTLLSLTWQEQLINGTLFIGTLIFGTLLIKSVIREVEQREKIEKLSEDKSKFISFASHEIRGPLTFIKGAAANILEGDFGTVSDGLKDNLQKIFVRANDVLGLVEQYLDKSKLELGQLKYERADFDLQFLIAQTIHTYQPSADQRGVSLRFTAAEGEEYTIHGDQAKIKEVVNNLVDNAIKFSPKGTVDVVLSKTAQTVLVKITDSGIGIPKETMPLLFREFSRAGNVNQAQIAGTGLGLFLSKTFIEAHGGRIWAESEGENKGARFVVELPNV